MSKTRQLRLRGMVNGERPSGRLGLALDHNLIARRLDERERHLEELDATPRWWYGPDVEGEVEREEREYEEDTERLRKIGALLAPYGLKYWWGPSQSAR